MAAVFYIEKGLLQLICHYPDEQDYALLVLFLQK